ncbi:DUF2274 domain-containing protein [Magnetospirillum fulvum]|uniref:DUF2274 domain-containing protein n=1 Tax=Magnetospirillum fulvum TaxID=1082 RepID=A0A1H6I042_MAGFU|nr:DUF2274 domain-containing protein [Magnetospirillum fulvum]SEH41795.1 hypothetical protein SAMN04244559_02231 [Magnetospirillum fulvum]
MLKLGKLPDRTPVRIVITVSPDLNRDLVAYAEAYRQAYGHAETVADLIPSMLDLFLASDRGFVKARKDGAITADAVEPTRRRRRKEGTPDSILTGVGGRFMSVMETSNHPRMAVGSGRSPHAYGSRSSF